MVSGPLLAALALAQSAPTAAPALLPGETLLEVSEEGEVRAVPDIARIEAEVVGEGATSREALARAADAAGAIVRAAAKAGVAARDVRLEPVSVRPRFKLDSDGDETDQRVGFRAEAPVRIRNVAVAAVPALLDALAQAGANELTGPYFGFADDRPLRARARNEAIAAAGREAADYAAALGKRVGRVLRVSERSAAAGGTGDIVVTALQWGRLLPIQPGEQTVEATVWIDYALVDR